MKSPNLDEAEPESSLTDGLLLAALSEQSSEALTRSGLVLIAKNEIEEALERLRIAAKRSYMPAMLEVARILLFLRDATADVQEAQELLQACERAGDPQASYLLAMVELGRPDRQRDPDRILRRLRHAAQRGFIPALRGLALLAGRGARRGDQVTACMLMSEAANAGDATSALLLAERWRLADGVAADPARAEHMLRQLLAAGHSPLPVVPARRLGWPAGSEDDVSQLDIGSALRAPTARVLSANPSVRLIEGLLTPEECRFLIAMARPYLRRSRAFDPDQQAAGEYAIRTSSDAAFDVTMEDFYLRLLQARIAEAGGCALRQGEPLVVLSYAPTQHYLPHRDYLPPAALAARQPGAGQRRTTVCVYLNSVAAGGQTRFLVPGIDVEPVAGNAVVFENLHPDGRPDPDSQHAGMPVITGEKWLATLWLRERNFRRY